MADPLAQVKEALALYATAWKLLGNTWPEPTDALWGDAGDAARAALPALDTLGEELARLRADVEALTGAMNLGAAAMKSHRADLADAESRLAKCQDALREARDGGLIYWEPRSGHGVVAKAEMLARIDAALGETTASPSPPKGGSVETSPAGEPLSVPRYLPPKFSEIRSGLKGDAHLFKEHREATPPPDREEAPATTTAPDRAADGEA